VLHALPVGYTLDGVKGIRDPRGMVARQFGVDMNVVTADATVAKEFDAGGRALPSQCRGEWRQAPMSRACRS